jgi:hypothetical protein
MKNNLDFLNDILSEVEKGSTFSAPKDQNTEAAPKDHFTLPKGISFDSNSKLTQRDAANLIQQAQDKAEEVDTIAFGLELNDGEIVKVYVATQDAEAFEKAMSDLLGKEDDIETAINDLAGEFDIVSVEWPEDDMTGDGGSSSDVGDAADDAMAGEDGDGNIDDLADKKEKKTKLGFDLNQSKEEDEKDDANADKDEDNLDAPDDDKDKEEDDAFGGLDFGNKEDDNEEKDDEEDALTSPDDEEEKDGKKKPTSKKKKKPVAASKKKGDEKLVDSIQQTSTSSWLFSSFLKEEPDFGIVSEESKKEDKAEEKIEDLFKTAMQRKIILLGMPALRLSQGKSLLRHGVREAALGMVDNPKGRIFLHRALKELEDILGTGEAEKAEKELAKKKDSDEKEKIDESAGQGTNVMFEHILQLLEALGVPHQLLHTRKSMLRQALKPTIVHLIKHGKLRNYIAGLSKALGIKPLHHSDTESQEDEEVVKEAIDLGNDAYLSLVSTLASSLGIPDENLNYKRSNLIQSLRQRKQQLNLPAVRVRAAALAKALASNANANVNEEFMYEEASRHFRDNAVDLGAWSIGKTGERIRLAIDSLEIKLSSTEAKNLHHAIDNGFETTVRSGNEHFNFKPITHGVEYVVIPLDSDNEFHKDGIKLGKKSVEAFLNLW